MEKIKLQIMNFETGLWSEWLPILVGNEGQFVYDKSTDSGKVSFKVYQETEPVFNVDDWVNVGHFTSEPYILTFDSDGLPVNHEQYAIASVEMVQSKSKAFWTVSLALVEPIEMLRGVPTETLDFTNQVSKTVSEPAGDVTYTKEAYTQLTALERVLKVTPANNDKLNVLDRSGNAWFNRIEILDKPFLSSLPFNDDTLSSGDLFTTLFKFDDYVDRTPVVYFDYLLLGQNNFPTLRTTVVTTINIDTDGLIGFTLKSDFDFNRSGTAFTLKGDDITLFWELYLGGTFYYEIGGELYVYTVTNINTDNDPYLAAVTFEIKVYETEAVTENKLADTTRPCYKLKFERKDGFDKSELVYNSLIANNTGLAINKTLDNYATGVRSEVDNLTTTQVLKFPSQRLWAVCELDTDGRDTASGGVTDKGNWFIRLPFPVKRVTKINKLTMSWPLGGTFTRTNADIDLKYILEDQEYKASELFVTNKDNLFHYQEGEFKLYVNEYYYLNDESTGIYYVEYEPLIDTSLQYGGGDYITNVNQSDSQTDALKYCDYLNNYLKGMNKYDILITKNYYDYTDFADLVGSRVIKDEEEFIITKVAYKNFNSGYVVVLSLNKDHFRRNINVQGNSQIKPNRVIEYSNLKDRRSLIDDTLNIGLSAVTNDMKLLSNKLLLLSALIPTQVSSSLTPQFVVYRTFSKLKRTTNISEAIPTKIVYRAKELITTPAKQVNKSQIQYNFLLDNNAQAGVTKTKGLDFSDVQTQYPILFTDPFGEVDKIDFKFTYLDNGDFPSTTDPAEINRTSFLYRTMLAMPDFYSSAIRTQILNNTIFSVLNVNYKKSMLEKPNFAFTFNINAGNKIIACNKLYELSRLIATTDTHTLKIMGFNKKRKENDLLTSGKLWETAVTSTYDTSKITLGFAGQSTTNLKSLVITTNNNDKLLILNDLTSILADVVSGSVKIYY